MNAAEQLKDAAATRILVKDGAYGTQVQARRLREADYAGSLGLSRDQKGNNDLLNLTRPDLIREIAQSFADAGADILATNTFNANRISQADYGAESLVRDINIEAARIIREVADADGRKRWVAGALGPTNKTLVTVARRQRSRLSRGRFRPGLRRLCRADRGAGRGRRRLRPDRDRVRHAERQGRDPRRAASRPGPADHGLDDDHRPFRAQLSGHSIESFWASVRHARPLTIGLNCSFGAAQLRAHIAALSPLADTLDHGLSQCRPAQRSRRL